MDELFVREEYNGFPPCKHRLMLGDGHRVRSFARALARRVGTDTSVIDLGAGSGILSLLAARAGAQRVFAVEASALAGTISATARRHGFGDAIRVHRQDLFGAVPRSVRGDLMIAELIGQFGIDEDIVEIVARWRDRLHGSRTIIPERISLFVQPVTSPELYDVVDYWCSPRYGLTFEALRSHAATTPYIFWSARRRPLAAAECLKTFSLATATTAAGRHALRTVATRSGALHGFVGWFAATLVDDLRLGSRTTGHWSRVFFPCLRPRRVEAGDKLSFVLEIRERPSRGRWKWTCE
jgi:hypothetical protein